MPATALHPWFAEQALSARNRLRFARTRLGETVGLGLAWTAILGLFAYLWTYLNGDWPGLILQNLARLPPVSLLLFFLVAFVLTRYVVLWLCRELRYGWWGASPIHDARRRAAARWLAPSPSRLASTVARSAAFAGLTGEAELIATGGKTKEARPQKPVVAKTNPSKLVEL